MHTNFSTKQMREDGGYDAIVAGCEALGKNADLHVKNYGANIKGVAKDLIEIDGILSIFTGPGFLTITKEGSSDWNMINNDILNKFDTM